MSLHRYFQICTSLTVNSNDRLAFQYPYVLAFEPTFVEIRHVQTGAMAQIIQGNNLRCLFADSPPSLPVASASQQLSPYQQQQQQMYNQVGQSQAGRQSLPNGYGSQYPHLYQPQQVPFPQRPAPPFSRDEILVVSDDRIMRLQMHTPPQPTPSPQMQQLQIQQQQQQPPQMAQSPAAARWAL